MSKPGRNDPCPCGSGKKYKKCCELKIKEKKFTATKIDTQQMTQKSQGISSLFQKKISVVTTPAQEKIKEQPAKEEQSKEDQESK